MRTGIRLWLTHLASVSTVGSLLAVVPVGLSSTPNGLVSFTKSTPRVGTRGLAAVPVTPVPELGCVITADGNPVEWPAGTQLLNTVGDPPIGTGLLCVRHRTAADPSSATDTLYLYINVTDNSSSSNDSVIVMFDTNRDLTFNSNDKGVWFLRTGAAQTIDNTLTAHLGALGPLATGTPALNPCGMLTRVCIFNIAGGAWRVEAKLVPSDFGMPNFAGTVGAFLEAFNGATNSRSVWPGSLVVMDPTGWIRLKLGIPNYRFCFRDVINTPDAFTTPPVIDGTVTGGMVSGTTVPDDHGWTSAWRYVFLSGVTQPNVIVQGIKNTTNIYLSFEVRNDASLDASDLVSIGIDPSSTDGDEWHLNIKPLIAGGVSPTITKEHWTGSNTGSIDNAPSVVVAAHGPLGPNSWSLEVQIPNAAITGLPTAQDFGLYVDVHPTAGPFGTTGEFQWPTEKNAFMGGTEYLFPDPGNWGRATLAGVSCNGVSIAPSDIATTNSPPNHIALTTPNTFTATVHNSSISGAGSYIPATNIQATFKIANFGLPSLPSWSTVRADPGTPNPTPQATIPANGSATLSFNWTLNPTEQGQYNTNTTDHQCILVELDAGGAIPTMTTFANKSAWTNMQFGGTASAFEGFAVVDGRGYGTPPQGRATHVFQLTAERSETTFVEPPDRDSDSAGRKWRPFSQLTYLVHGCRLSGRRITIGQRTFNVCESVGAFGYVVSHEGAKAPAWRVALSGRGLSQPAGESGNRFSLLVPPNSLVPLHVVIAAGRRGVPLWVWLIILLILFLLLAWKLAKARR